MTPSLVSNVPHWENTPRLPHDLKKTSYMTNEAMRLKNKKAYEKGTAKPRK